MSNQNENINQVALAQRLNDLRVELQENLRQTRQRGRGVLITLLNLILAIGAYWAYIYQRISTIDADAVADLAYSRVLTFARQSPPLLSQALRNCAPDVFDFAEAELLRMPEVSASYIRDMALDKTRLILDDARPKIDQVISDAIANAKTHASIAGIDGKNPDQLDKFIDSLTRQIHEDARKEVDRIYVDYDAQAQGVVNYLNLLADGRKLDPRQQHLREVIISFLALSEKWKTQPPTLITP